MTKYKMGRNCYNCGHNPCSCDIGTVIKQIAAPTFTEDLYKFATENGLFTGTIGEFILYMKGSQGDSVYEWAVKNGFTTLPKEEWYNQYIGTMSYSVDEW